MAGGGTLKVIVPRGADRRGETTRLCEVGLPQLVSADAPGSLARMLELSVVFMALTFVIFAGYGICAGAVRRHVITRPQVLAWMRRAFAGAFVALGAKLALSER